MLKVASMQHVMRLASKFAIKSRGRLKPTARKCLIITHFLLSYRLQFFSETDNVGTANSAVWMKIIVSDNG